MVMFWLVILILTLFSLIIIVRPLVLTSEPNYMTAVILIILLPLCSLSFYFYLGYYHQVAQWMTTKERAAVVKNEINKLGSREAITLALKKRLEQLPMNAENAKGWFILGKLYTSEHKNNEALDAFRKAMALSPGNIEYILQYVSTKLLAHEGLDDESKNLLEKILKKQPNNVNAINLLGVDAYLHKEYAVAIRHWENLLQYFAPDSTDAQAVLEMIRQAQQDLTTSVKSKTLKIKVQISVDELLKGKINPSDTLFVYALSAKGPKIPLAVTKQAFFRSNVTHVTLDSNQNMLPDKHLSKGQEVYIEARISKSGNALPSKGDLVGKSPVFKMNADEVLVDLNIKNIEN